MADINNEITQEGTTPNKNVLDKAQTQVRETEDASLQDDTYAFDTDNTDVEEYHDADDAETADIDFDSDEDFIQ